MAKRGRAEDDQLFHRLVRDGKLVGDPDAYVAEDAQGQPLGPRRRSRLPSASLTIFPTLTAVVSLYGLVADPNMVERQITAMQGVLPPEAVKLIATWLQALVQGPATRFGIGLIVSVLLAFWSMWSATGVPMTAVNICYGEEEKRGFVSFNLHALALGAGLALFGTAALALVAVLPAALAVLPLTAAWSDVLGLIRWPIWLGSSSLRSPSYTATRPIARSRNGNGSVGGRLQQQRYGSWARLVSRPTSRRSAATTRPTARLAASSFCCSGSI